MIRQLFKKTFAFFSSAIIICSSYAAIPAYGTDDEVDRVGQIIDNMTVRQKITQMFEVDVRKWSYDGSAENEVHFTVMNDEVRKIIEDYDFGAVILFAENIKETEQSYNLMMDFQKAAVKDNGIPLIISTDQEGGNIYRLGSGTALTGNMALGATQEPMYAEKAGEIIGNELSVLGINTCLAPVVDVNNNANNPVIGVRSYGDDPETVGLMASSAIRGMEKYNVIGCAKHFPGHGDTDIDSHYGLPIVNKTKEELLENELLPYNVAINNGIEMIMTAHIIYPELDNSLVYSEKTGNQEKVPATMSKAIITDLLKNEMGFDGIVTTDAMIMDAIATYFDEVQAVKEAIKAGADLICMPYTIHNPNDLKIIDGIIEGIENAVISGEIPESRLDDAVSRILTVKEKRGILDWNESDYSIEKALATVGSDANRETEREIAVKAVTIIKNDNQLLPLEIKKDSKVLMLVPYENELSQMAMGWNRAKEAGLIPDEAEMKVFRFSSDTILDNIKKELDWADTYFVSSEMYRSSYIKTHWLYNIPEAVVDYGHNNGKKSIVISGDKPYDVQLYENADAIMAIYGCAGSSVNLADALRGATTSKSAFGPNIIAGIEVALGVSDASGKLPVNIPKYDYESASFSDEILYERGYGLTYHSRIYTVKYIIDGTIIDTQKVVYGSDAQTPDVPQREDYTAEWDKDTKNITADIEINAVYTPIVKNYKITSGDKQNVSKGKTAVFTSDADYDRFVKVLVDGAVLDSKYYSVENDSTKITLKSEYTKTLSTGNHSISIVSDNGEASAVFTVSDTQNKWQDSPKTGDFNNNSFYLLIISNCIILIISHCIIKATMKKSY